MWRTKATMIYRRTNNLRVVQLLLGHSKLASTIRYLDIKVNGALKISEQIEIQNCPATAHTLLCGHFLARYRVSSIGNNRRF